LAIWLSAAARSVEGKVIAIAFPISAFVALGFEHCVANFYLLTIGMLSGSDVTLASFTINIAAVTLGNTLGGIVIAAILFLIYLGKDQVRRSRPIFTQPVVEPPSQPTTAAPQVEPAVDEPIQIAAVRLRLKSMHGDPATPTPRDPVRTRPSWLGPRSQG
jgi:hypothetical protein